MELFKKYKLWQGSHSHKIFQTVVWFIAICAALPLTVMILAEIGVTSIIIHFFAIMAVVIAAFVTKPI